MLDQSMIAEDILIVDSSTTEDTINAVASLCALWPQHSTLRTIKASIAGAAPQRNQGFKSSTLPFVMFMDDDIFFQPRCMELMWAAIEKHDETCGVTPTYHGYGYHQPGFLGRIVMGLLNGKPLPNYAGKVLGPGFTQLPEDSNDRPSIVPIDWMGSGCALYRRESLPLPPFPERFQGASLFEDLCLSLTAGKRGQLVNARLARAIHAEEGGEHKKGRHRLAKMEIVNRYFIMRRVLDRHSVADHLRFLVMIGYMTTGAFKSPRKWLQLPAHLLGLIAGAISICWHFGSFRSDENDR